MKNQLKQSEIDFILNAMYWERIITQGLGLLKKAGIGGNKYDIEQSKSSIRVKLAK